VAVPAGQDAEVDENGRMAVSEVTFDRAGAASPFGESLSFPLPASDLSYHHPADHPTEDH
jgi:succinate dehydrogenase / fumarate reductase iron-sulfur subunit